MTFAWVANAPALIGLGPYAQGLAILIALTLVMVLLLGLERSRYHSDAHTIFAHERETT
jgi:hypothetical protein